jgi:hypothetical protein
MPNDVDSTQHYVSPESGASSNLPEIDENHAELSVHLALTAGDIQHVVMGIWKERLDYCIYGTCLDELGTILDLSKGGME